MNIQITYYIKTIYKNENENEIKIMNIENFKNYNTFLKNIKYVYKNYNLTYKEIIFNSIIKENENIIIDLLNKEKHYNVINYYAMKIKFSNKECFNKFKKENIKKLLKDLDA